MSHLDSTKYFWRFAVCFYPFLKFATFWTHVTKLDINIYVVKPLSWKFSYD